MNEEFQIKPTKYIHVDRLFIFNWWYTLIQANIPQGPTNWGGGIERVKTRSATSTSCLASNQRKFNVDCKYEIHIAIVSLYMKISAALLWWGGGSWGRWWDQYVRRKCSDTHLAKVGSLTQSLLWIMLLNKKKSLKNRLLNFTAICHIWHHVYC